MEIMPHTLEEDRAVGIKHYATMACELSVPQSSKQEKRLSPTYLTPLGNLGTAITPPLCIPPPVSSLVSCMQSKARMPQESGQAQVPLIGGAKWKELLQNDAIKPEEEEQKREKKGFCESSSIGGVYMPSDCESSSIGGVYMPSDCESSSIGGVHMPSNCESSSIEGVYMPSNCIALTYCKNLLGVV
ncbi:hypothetical protein STEG23_007246, partial [Scotinomys teguina]